MAIIGAEYSGRKYSELSYPLMLVLLTALIPCPLTSLPRHKAKLLPLHGRPEVGLAASSAWDFGALVLEGSTCVIHRRHGIEGELDNPIFDSTCVSRDS